MAVFKKQIDKNLNDISSINDLILYADSVLTHYGEGFRNAELSQTEIKNHLIKLRDDILFKMVAGLEFYFDLFKLMEMGGGYWMKIPKHKDYRSLSEYLTREYERQSGPLERMICASLFLFWESVNGNADQARQEWLIRLFPLQVGRICLSDSETKSFQTAMRYFFPDVNETIRVYRNYISNQMDFWQKEVNEQKSDIFWLTSILWNAYNASIKFSGVYPVFLDLMKQAMSRSADEFVLFLHHALVSIWLINAQSQEEYERFNNDVEKSYEEYTLNLVTKWKVSPVIQRIESNKAIRIGFVVDRLVLNSPFKVLYSLLKSLVEMPVVDGQKIIFYVYDCDNPEKAGSDPSIVQMIKNLGVTYRNLHAEFKEKGLYYSVTSKIRRLRDVVVNDEIHVLCPGSSSVTATYLFVSRAAPFQFYWSHGNQCYDMDGIDARIMHGTMGYKSMILNKNKYYFYHQAMDSQFYCPPVDFNLLKRLRGKFPTNQVILGSISRNAKVDSEDYLNVVFRIMGANPNTIYLACGAGDYRLVKRKFADHGLAERVYIEGLVNPHIYGNIIDIFLDTFPFRNGESIAEYRAKGGVCVFLADENSKSSLEYVKNDLNWIFDKYGNEVIENNEILFWIPMAFSVDEYVAIASRLIRDPILRKKVGRATKILTDENMFDMSRQAKSFMELMTELTKQLSTPSVNA